MLYPLALWSDGVLACQRRLVVFACLPICQCFCLSVRLQVHCVQFVCCGITIGRCMHDADHS